MWYKLRGQRRIINLDHAVSVTRTRHNGLPAIEIVMANGDVETDACVTPEPIDREWAQILTRLS